MHENMLEFKWLFGLPSIHGAIDGTHFALVKPKLIPKITIILYLGVLYRSVSNCGHT
jgi:hypothetical protein